MSQNHLLYSKFGKSIESEKKAGLYTDTKPIANRQGWERRPQSCGTEINDRRVIR